LQTLGELCALSQPSDREENKHGMQGLYIDVSPSNEGLQLSPKLRCHPLVGRLIRHKIIVTVRHQPTDAGY
jgi:hypothetical protein